MLISYGARPISAGVGQYVTACCSFRSTTDLASKVVKFSPGIYTTTIPSNLTNVAFQSVYAIGTTMMTNLGNTNGQAWIEAIDAYNFKVYFEFIVGATANGWSTVNQTANSNLFNAASGISDFIGFYVNVCGEETTCFQQINIGLDQCDFNATFQDSNGDGLNGFIPGEDLTINLQGSVLANNSFYVGFYNQQITDGVDIFSGLGLSYAQISSGVINQLDQDGNPVNNSCIKDGLGFTTMGNTTSGKIVISGDCLAARTCYGFYIVYQTAGQWKTCFYEVKRNTNLNIDFECTTVVTDCFGNTSEGNVSGVSSCSPLDFGFTIDETLLNQSLSDLGYTGTFSDYLVSTNIIAANSQGGDVGDSLVNTSTNNNIISAIGYVPSSGSEKWIYGCWELNIEGITCRLYCYVQVQYNTTIIEETGTLIKDGEQTDVICLNEGGTYSISGKEDCKLQLSVNGGQFSDLSGDINSELLEPGEVCIKKVCPGTPTNDDCECPPCENASISILFEPEPETGITLVDVGSNNGFDLVVEETISNQTQNGNTSVVFVLNTSQGSVNLIISLTDPATGCTWQTNYSGLMGFQPPVNITIPGQGQQDCECPDDVVCDNNAQFKIECDNSTGTISLDVIKNFNSGISNENFLCSINGQPPVTCPNSIVGEENVFITYDASFEDGCDSIHLEQEISCLIDEDCAISSIPTIQVDNDCLLQISFNDNFGTATVLSDILIVDGQSFDLNSGSYTPIQLSGSGISNWNRTVIFENGCPELPLSGSIDYDCDNIGDCDYSTYQIECDYNEDTCEFSITRSGDQSELEVNELKFCLNDGKERKYTKPVIGTGFFAATWCIKAPGCPLVELEDYCSVKQTLGEVTLDLPDELDVKIVNDKECPVPVIVCGESGGDDTKHTIVSG